MAFSKILTVAIVVCLVAVLLPIFFRKTSLGGLIPPAITNFGEEILQKAQSYLGLQKSENIFTKEELSNYKGLNDGPIYLALLGKVYDVTKGRKHYGPGGGYAFFAGRDGTRAYATGDFTDKGLIDDLSDLPSSSLLEIINWQKFYKKEYTYIGKLDGLFYDTHGKPTAAMEDFKHKLAIAREEEKKGKKELSYFPPCNSEYGEDRGRRVWCTNQSGGIRRTWTGVPRQYFKPGVGQPRCACIKESGASAVDPSVNNNRGDLDNPHIKLYPGCDPAWQACPLSD